MNKIGWCDETINPLIGCTKVSDACTNCYAEVMANRLAGMKYTKKCYNRVITNGKWNGNVVFRRDELLKPDKWKKPKRIFITSMGDLFHKNIFDSWLVSILFMIVKNPQHTFIMLTKRPERMNYFFTNCAINPFVNPPPNLWLGVTVENQIEAEHRIPILLNIPAKVHFISCEPLLENINLECWEEGGYPLGLIDELDWVIAGGETGTHARITPVEYFRDLRDQCWNADVPFFFKKIGSGIETPKDLDIHEFPFFNLKR
jgi:protein gp37